MELKGQIEEIIYQNDSNSYTIAVFETEENVITIVRIFTIYNSWGFIKSYWKNGNTSRLWRAI